MTSGSARAPTSSAPALGTAQETRARPTGEQAALAPRSSFPRACHPPERRKPAAGASGQAARDRARASRASTVRRQVEAAGTTGERRRAAHRRRHDPGLGRLPRRRRRPGSRGSRPHRSRRAAHLRRPCNPEQGLAVPLFRLASDPGGLGGLRASRAWPELDQGTADAAFATDSPFASADWCPPGRFPFRQAGRGSGLLPGAFPHLLDHSCRRRGPMALRLSLRGHTRARAVSPSRLASRRGWVPVRHGSLASRPRGGERAVDAPQYRLPAAMPAAQPTFYYDLGSPYAYLAAERINDGAAGAAGLAADPARRHLAAERRPLVGRDRRARGGHAPRSSGAPPSTGSCRSAGPTRGRATSLSRCGPRPSPSRSAARSPSRSPPSARRSPAGATSRDRQRR